MGGSLCKCYFRPIFTTDVAYVHDNAELPIVIDCKDK